MYDAICQRSAAYRYGDAADSQRVKRMKAHLILGNNLKKIRSEKNLSQTQLAKLAGVSRNTITSIENGLFCPTAKLALVLCNALEKKFEELFFLKE